LAPSIWSEAYGRVVTEAQYSGIPVLASNRGGLPEAVGAGGVVLDPAESIDTWAHTLRRLWDDKIYYQVLSHAAREHAARASLRWDAQAPIWEQIIGAATSEST
jgi:glycosyltransferase involved in cell wall biosynthesis